MQILVREKMMWKQEGGQPEEMAKAQTARWGEQCDLAF